MLRSAAAIVVAVAITGCSGAAKRPGYSSRIAGFVLPSRRPAYDEATARMHRLLAQAARQLPARIVDLGPPSAQADDRLARARELELAGALDEAASTYDVALEAAARAPAQTSNRAQLVSATLARISIALARNEGERADVLLERLLRYDQGLLLSTDEDRPSLRDALERARARLGEAPALDHRDLGGACDAQVDMMFVARLLAGTRLEVVRVEHCRQVATTVVDPAAADEVVARELIDQTGAARADRRGAPSEQRRLYTRPWFIAVMAGVVVGTVVGTYTLTQDRGVDVVPHW